jgi:N-acetylglutamate synthase-like GNAT family acetyltransferase/mannose-6-phosphate isomerase-like protein (cupin superfamily)
MSEVEYAPGDPGDAEAIRTLVSGEGLPVEDLGAAGQAFLVARVDGRLVGCIGVEVAGADCLLRSLAVAAGHRGRGIAVALNERAFALASRRGCRTAWLLTTHASGLAARLGFEQVARSDVPPGVAALPQLRGLCPSSAVCMRRGLAGEVRHYPRDVLRLEPDVPGAAFFAVALERVMLTAFEVEPGARFERHAHEADQITMVLEGELVFELDGGREVRVGPGEVIALPSGAPHAARAEARRVKAVDAWSPPRR